MIWATVSSRSCFCWLYRASPSLAAKNIINLISVLTIWWCPCVESSLVSLEEGVCYDHAFSWQNSISLCPASFRIPRPNLPVTPGVSRRRQWHPTPALLPGKSHGRRSLVGPSPWGRKRVWHDLATKQKFLPQEYAVGFCHFLCLAHLFKMST